MWPVVSGSAHRKCVCVCKAAWPMENAGQLLYKVFELISFPNLEKRYDIRWLFPLIHFAREWNSWSKMATVSYSILLKRQPRCQTAVYQAVAWFVQMTFVAVEFLQVYHYDFPVIKTYFEYSACEIECQTSKKVKYHVVICLYSSSRLT